MTKASFLFLALGFILVGCNFPSKNECKGPESFLTILATNDIHGGIEHKVDKKLGKVGGTAFFAGVIEAIKSAVTEKHGACGGVVVLDGGDQFQGTLMSNYTEGSIVFDVFNTAKYDAIVPGNHDYDFGPLGWLIDKPQNAKDDPREVIKLLAQRAKFPMLSANTYFKDTVTDIAGNPLEIDNVGCKPKDPSKTAAFYRAVRPDFFKPYIIKEVAGLKVAIIGLDNAETSKVTTIENVSDLCFRTPADEYLELRAQLNDKADVFLIVIHDGDGSDKSLSNMIAKIAATDKAAHGITGSILDAVVGGHTHFVNKLNVSGIPAIQSGSGGQMFGRIDLTFDRKLNKVNEEKPTYAGVRLLHNDCDTQIQNFCEVKEAAKPFYESKEVVLNAEIAAQIAAMRAQLAPMADRKLGEATKKVWRDRILESPLGNFLTDVLRLLTGADIAIINTGGIREDIAAGPITYEILYSVLPFGNHAVVLSDVSFESLMKLLTRSIQSCGIYGSLVQSGINIEYTRNCDLHKDTGLDPDAKITKITLLNGEILLDRAKEIQADPARKFKVMTLDFLASGGSGYDDFKGHVVEKDFGIAREAMADYLEKNPVSLDDKIDGRLKQVQSQQN